MSQLDYTLGLQGRSSVGSKEMSVLSTFTDLTVETGPLYEPFFYCFRNSLKTTYLSYPKP